MFKCYFDASGDDHTQLLVVAGFVSHTESWIDWEAEWLERLSKDGLEYFHNRKLCQWELGRRKRLVADLSEITSHHVSHNFGVIVKNSDLTGNVSKTAREKWRIQAYSLAGRTIARGARLWAENWGGRIPELVFERGDKGQGNLHHLLVSQGYPEPIFRPKRKYRDRKSGILYAAAVPLQAGDLLAGQIFAIGRSVFMANGVQSMLYRINNHLDKIPGEFRVIEAERYKLIRQGFEEIESLIMVPSANIKAC